MKITPLLFALFILLIIIITYFITLMLVPKRVGFVYKTSDPNVKKVMNDINAKIYTFQSTCKKDVLPMVQQLLTNAGDQLVAACDTSSSALATNLTTLLDPLIKKYLPPQIKPSIDSAIIYIAIEACNYSKIADNKTKLDLISAKVLSFFNAVC